MTSAAITTHRLAEHADAIRALGKQTVDNVIEIGRRLSECKKEIGHGGWQQWLDAEFGWSEQSALRFMWLYDFSKSKTNKLLDLDLPLSSLYLLAAPETSDLVRDGILARAEKGEKIKHRDVANAVAGRRGKSSKAKVLKGLKARIVELIKVAPSGLTTDEVIARISDALPQTVNSSVNALVKSDTLRETGEKRKTRAGGGREARVYAFNPNPNPDNTAAKSKKAAADKVVDFGARKVPALVEQLGLATERMTHDERIKVAWQVTKRLRVATAQVSQYDLREARKAGLVQEIHFTGGKGRVNK